ncbi:MAG: hypothetical protein KC897_00930 [Candidatus Omnitrophica bacterium]|nr:hypothetical protein [Candidatus Omnitrophota bacterium]MCB9720168.1 hypothetical protein [Candidatus Omnitrophota bacterium]
MNRKILRYALWTLTAIVALLLGLVLYGQYVVRPSMQQRLKQQAQPVSEQELRAMIQEVSP